MDAAGWVRVSTHFEHEGKSAEHNEYFKQGLKATYIQDTYVSGLTGRLSMVISAPIKDEIGKVIGVLGTRLNLKTLQALIKGEKGLGLTGETVVVAAAVEDIMDYAVAVALDPVRVGHVIHKHTAKED